MTAKGKRVYFLFFAKTSWLVLRPYHIPAQWFWELFFQGMKWL
jgi:hypothetical protein